MGWESLAAGAGREGIYCGIFLKRTLGQWGYYQFKKNIYLSSTWLGIFFFFCYCLLFHQHAKSIESSAMFQNACGFDLIATWPRWSVFKKHHSEHKKICLLLSDNVFSSTSTIDKSPHRQQFNFLTPSLPPTHTLSSSKKKLNLLTSAVFAQGFKKREIERDYCSATAGCLDKLLLIWTLLKFCPMI